MLCLMTDKPMASVNETDGRFETNLEPSPVSWAASDAWWRPLGGAGGEIGPVMMAALFFFDGEEEDGT